MPFVRPQANVGFSPRGTREVQNHSGDLMNAKITTKNVDVLLMAPPW